MQDRDTGVDYAGISWVRSLGYPDAGVPMRGELARWWGWYRATGAFYSATETSVDGLGTFKVDRISMNPAKMACEDWAGILFNYRTSVGLEGVTDLDDGDEPEEAMQATLDWMTQWVKDVGLLTRSASFERCFALGAYGFALGLDGLREDGEPDPGTRVTLRRHDAREIVPLSWDDEGCTEAAFVSGVTVGGRRYTQWAVYTLDDEGCCVIRTAHFLGNGRRAELEGFASEVRTGVPGPLFRIVRPEIDNTYEARSPFGVSVFDAAIGSIVLADGAVDNAWKDLFLGQKMLFVPEDMLARDEKGGYVVPRAKDQQLFLARRDGTVAENQGVDEYNPDLRTEDNRRAVSLGLQLFGKRCGLGMRYYALDDAADRPKTAKEVGADNAELMRNAKKHEQAMGAQMARLVESACALASRFCGEALPDVSGKACIVFGDSVIQDEDTERERMRADVAAGLVPAWKYAATYYGVDPETARKWTGESALGDGVPEEA